MNTLGLNDVVPVITDSSVMLIIVNQFKETVKVTIFSGENLDFYNSVMLMFSTLSRNGMNRFIFPNTRNVLFKVDGQTRCIDFIGRLNAMVGKTTEFCQQVLMQLTRLRYPVYFEFMKSPLLRCTTMQVETPLNWENDKCTAVEAFKSRLFQLAFSLYNLQVNIPEYCHGDIKPGSVMTCNELETNSGDELYLTSMSGEIVQNWRLRKEQGKIYLTDINYNSIIYSFSPDNFKIKRLCDLGSRLFCFPAVMLTGYFDHQTGRIMYDSYPFSHTEDIWSYGLTLLGVALKACYVSNPVVGTEMACLFQLVESNNPAYIQGVMDNIVNQAKFFSTTNQLNASMCDLSESDLYWTILSFSSFCSINHFLGNGFLPRRDMLQREGLKPGAFYEAVEQHKKEILCLGTDDDRGHNVFSYSIDCVEEMFPGMKRLLMKCLSWSKITRSFGETFFGGVIGDPFFQEFSFEHQQRQEERQRQQQQEEEMQRQREELLELEQRQNDASLYLEELLARQNPEMSDSPINDDWLTEVIA